MKYTCPCCGYKILDEQPPGTFEICTVCYWEDDNVQFYNPDFEGGANEPSLRTAQNNYRLFGVSEERYKKNVSEPNGQFEKDSDWKPFK